VGGYRQSVPIQIPPALRAHTLRALFALPSFARRAVTGGPVVRQGLTLDRDPQLVLRLQKLLREPVLGTQPVAQGRRIMLADAQLIGGNQPISSVVSLEVAGRRARLYVPSTPTDALLVFLHGGAWVYGDLDSHDAPCRVLAEKAGVRVLSIDYRLAPEAPFPAAYDDCLAAYRWVVANAALLGASPSRLAVGGDSAGGNLAAAVALAAAREGLPLAFQLLVYPATDLSDSETETASYREFGGGGFYLTKAMMDLGVATYLPDVASRTDPRVSVLLAPVPAGLAPAYLCTAGFDPLRDEGEAYAEKLREAGVPVEVERFEGQIHGFLNYTGIGRSGPAAVAKIAAKLAAGLDVVPARV
jgi:acetyl esterase